MNSLVIELVEMPGHNPMETVRFLVIRPVTNLS